MSLVIIYVLYLEINFGKKRANFSLMIYELQVNYIIIINLNNNNTIILIIMNKFSFY